MVTKARTRRQIHDDLTLGIEVEHHRLNEAFIRLRARGLACKHSQLKVADVEVVVRFLGLEAIKNLDCEAFLEKLKLADARKDLLRK